MRKFQIAAATALICGAFVSTGRTETLQVTDDTYLVKYSDGTAERYLVRYRAEYNSNWNEGGHPAIPEKGWFKDTRQCSWAANSSIERQACLVSRSGQTFCHANLNRIYNQNSTGKGSDFKLERLRPENCNDAAARREQDFSNVRSNVVSVMPLVINMDRETVISDFKSMGEVVEVSSD